MKWDTQLQVIRGPAGAFLAIPAPTEIMNKVKPDTDYSVEVKVKRSKRSLTANAYCWVLCQKIAEELSKGGEYVSKEAIYRAAVRDAGMFDYIVCKDYAAGDFKRRWEASGLGWQAEEVKRKADNVVFLLYQGSSVYNSAEMARLIECLIQEAQQLGVETKSEEEINSLLEAMDE